MTTNDYLLSNDYSLDDWSSSVSCLSEYSTTPVDQSIAYCPISIEDQPNVQDSDISDNDKQSGAREIAESDALQHQFLPENPSASEVKQFDLSSFAADWFRGIEDENLLSSQTGESANDAYIEKGPTCKLWHSVQASTRFYNSR